MIIATATIILAAITLAKIFGYALMVFMIKSFIQNNPLIVGGVIVLGVLIVWRRIK